MRLTKSEQETIILFNERDAAATVFTYNTRLQNRLMELYKSHPNEVKPMDDNRYGALCFELPKKWVKITSPRVLSEAQKQVLEGMNRKNRERKYGERG